MFDSLRDDVLEQRRAVELVLEDSLAVHAHYARQAQHFGIVVVAVERETMVHLPSVLATKAVDLSLTRVKHSTG